MAAWELRDTAEIPDLSSFLGELSHAMPDEVDSLHIFGVEETNDLSRLAALSLSNTAIVEVSIVLPDNLQGKYLR